MGFPRILASPVIFLFSEAGNILGTAFIVGYPVAKEPGMVVPLVVTAKHVVGDLQRVVGRFTTRSGCTPAMVPYDLEILRREGDLWLHNDDGVDLMVFRTLAMGQVPRRHPFVERKR